MPLEQQLTSLILSQRLKELNVKQESLFFWDNITVSGEYEIHVSPLKIGKYHATINLTEIDKDVEQAFSAFTVAELGEMLPKDFHLSMFRTISNGWGVTLDDIEQTALYGNTEADARAKMLCYLLENKLITLN